MEGKKVDYRSLIGFVLIGVILLWMIYNQTPTREELNKEKAKKEQIEKAKQKNLPEEKTAVIQDSAVADSVKLAGLKSSLGAFAYSATLPSAKNAVTELKNPLLTLRISNKGGYIAEANLNGFEQFHKGSNERVELIKNNNADFNLQFKTKDNRILNTRDMYFEPILSKNGENEVLTMRLKAGPQQFLEYRYEMEPNDYMIDFTIRTQGLSQIVDSSNPVDLEWQLKSYRNEKSVTYENRYTELVYEYEDGKDNYLGQGKNESEKADEVTYIAYKQHFFASVLLTDTPFKTADLTSENLVKDEKVDTLFTKNFTARVPLEFKGGELSYNMDWY